MKVSLRTGERIEMNEFHFIFRSLAEEAAQATGGVVGDSVPGSDGGGARHVVQPETYEEGMLCIADRGLTPRDSTHATPTCALFDRCHAHALRSVTHRTGRPRGPPAVARQPQRRRRHRGEYRL